MRLFKIPLLVFSILSVLAVLVFGVNLTSYARTSARIVQQTVQDTVPVEFELRRARDLIDGILPQLQAQVRMIAEEEVEISRLEADIEKSFVRLGSQRDALKALRHKAGEATFVSASVDKRSLPVDRLVGQLHRRFEQYKQGELAVQSKQQLLEARKQSLDAALLTLEKIRSRKIELEQKVEQLAAENRLVAVSRIENGRPIHGGQLSQADQLLSQIQTRLDVAQRVLVHQQDLDGGDDEFFFNDEPRDGAQVLNDIDAYFIDQEEGRREDQLAQMEILAP